MYLSPIQIQKLELRQWRVFTNDQITQQTIAEYLANEGKSEESTTRIFYDGKEVPVFIVPFKVVLFLAKNRVKVPYDFIAYHKEHRNKPWVIWKEGKKTSTERLSRLDFLFKRQAMPINKVLKEKRVIKKAQGAKAVF